MRPRPRHGARVLDGIDWVDARLADPDATAGPEDGASGARPLTAEGPVGGITRPALPRDYEDQVRAFYGGGATTPVPEEDSAR